MSDLLHVYRLLHEACRLLDDSSDHAIAAYVGLAMALIEDKYSIFPGDTNMSGTDVEKRSIEAPPPATLPDNGGSWA